MKIIDLLNKIANGEEVPKKIKWKDELFNDDVAYFLYEYIGDCSNIDIKLKLNCNVDIIEEPQEHKIPEKLKIRYKENDILVNEKILQEDINDELANKINEILDYLEEIE